MTRGLEILLCGDRETWKDRTDGELTVTDILINSESDQCVTEKKRRGKGTINGEEELYSCDLNFNTIITIKFLLYEVMVSFQQLDLN